MNKSKKNLKFTSIAWMLAIMLLAIVVLINVAASFFNVQLDMTPNKLYTLSSVTTSYLDELNRDNKKVDVYFLMDLDEVKNDPDANEVLALTNMFDKYQEYECINFIDIDPDTNPDIINELNPENALSLQSGDIVVKYNDIIKKVPAKEMYVYKTSTDSNGNVYTESGMFQGEKLVTNAIKSAVENITSSIYFLTGHGEKSLDDEYSSFKKNLMSQGYNVKELNLTTSEEVPDNADVIIVAAPKTDITAAEKEKLDKFMDNGGNLSLLMSPNEDKTEYNNLLDIMHEYCIGMDYNKIYETNDSRHASDDKYKIMVEFVDISKNSGESNDLTSGNLNLDSEKLTDLTSELILQQDTIIPYMPASRSFFDYAGDNYASLNICPLIQTYSSAESQKFGGNEIEEYNMVPPFYLSAYSEDPTRNNSKLLVMGNAEFIDDQTAQEGYTIMPVNLFITAISWMTETDINLDINAKERTYDYMELQTKEDTDTMIVIIVAAPVIVALAGIAIWLKRRNS